MKGFFQALYRLFLLCVLGLLVWSSHLMEQELKQMHRELGTLENTLKRLQLPTAPLPTTPVTQRLRPHIREDLPNLLQPDPYMTEVLPKQLGASFTPKGCRREAMTGRIDSLHPFNGFSTTSHFISLCMPALGQLHCGRFEAYAPDLAYKIEQRPRADLPEVSEYWVHLHEDIFWEPLDPRHFPSDITLASHFLEPHPVTAADFKFYYDAVMNPYVSEAKAVSLRTYLNDIEEIVIIDPLTFVVRWKPHLTSSEKPCIKYAAASLTFGLQPLPCFVFQHFADGEKILEEDRDPSIYRTSALWAQNFAQHWAQHTLVSCGPYIFEGMNEEGISLRRNPRYIHPHYALVEEYRVAFKASPDAVWQAFKAGDSDLCSLSSSQLSEWQRFMKSHEYQQQAAHGMAIHALDYSDRGFFYVGWNLQKPWFASTKVRQALTYAIDRSRIISSYLNERAVGLTGPFLPGSAAYDASLLAWPFDPDKACRLLDEEGWRDLDGDGIREKKWGAETLPFSFRLCYYVKSSSTKIIVEYIASALKEIGIHCEPYGVDLPDLSRQFDDKTFDALFLGWKLGSPPDDPRQIWHSSGAQEKGSSNAIGFANAHIDALIEQLNYEEEPEKRVSHYHQFHRIIYDQNPYTFLYIPKVCLLYRARVQNLFLPTEHPELIPDANIPEPNLNLLWIK